MTQTATPQVAVIILNWNGRKLLSEFLPSVVKYTPVPLARVIVADNGSADDSTTWLAERFPEVEVWKFPENYGFAEGYNRCLARSEAPYTVLLNSDVAVDSDWVTPLYDFMETHSRVGACQPKILSYRRPDTFEYAGACGGYIDRHGYPYCRGRLMGTVEKDCGQYDTPLTDLFWATGAALMVRTDLYRRAGGLDARFFAHMEEIDLCWRMKLLGYDIAVVPASRVYHLGGGSLDASNPRKTYLNFRNNLLMLYKNLPVERRRGVLLTRRLLDTVAWAKFMVTLDWKNAAAVWRAHRDFARMRKYYPEAPDRDLLSGHARPDLLMQYYLKGHHLFSQLN